MVAKDRELWELYSEVRRASEALVGRLEGYGEIVPSRPDEAAILDDVSRFALFVERAFRGWHERARNLREQFEDPDLRLSTASEPPEDDPRSGS